MASRKKRKERETRRKRSVFWLFLATYLTISVLSLPLTALSYTRFDRILQTKVGDQAAAQLAQAAQTANGVFASLQQAITALLVETQSSSLLYATLPPTPDQVITLRNETVKIHASLTSSGLYDLYIYYPQLQSVVTRSTRYSTEDFFKRESPHESYEQWMDLLADPGFLTIHPARQTSGVIPRTLLIQTAAVSTAGSGRVRATVVGAIDVSDLENAFSQTDFLTDGQVLVLKNGEVLCRMGGTLLNTEAMLSLGDGEGALWTQAQEKELLVLKAGQPGEIEYLCVMPAEAYLGEFTATRNLVLVILAVQLALGLILSVTFAWVTFSPIRSAARKLLPGYGSERSDTGNEIDAISHTSLMLLDENQRISQTLESQRETIRQSLVRQLLLGGLLGERMVWDSADLTFDGDFFVIVLFQIEETGEFGAEDSIEQRMLLVFTLMALMTKRFSDHTNCHGAELSPDQFGLVVNLASPEQAQGLNHTISGFFDDCYKDLGVVLSAGASNAVKGMTNVSQASEEARAALAHARLWQQGNAVFYGEITSAVSGYSYTQEMENAIIQGIRLGNDAAVQSAVDAVLKSSGQMPVALLRCLIYDMMGSALKLLGEMNTDPAEVFGTETSPVDQIEQCHSVDDMRGALLSTFNAIAGYLNSDRTSRNEQLCSKITALMQENYHDFDFSLAAAAQALGMNASYLSHVYKKQMGENFVDALNRIRIRHACDRLKESNEPITQVALSCGFYSAGYFSRTFKKLMGVTPGQYRGG